MLNVAISIIVVLAAASVVQPAGNHFLPGGVGISDNVA
jgi:hypothetical protein